MQVLFLYLWSIPRRDTPLSPRPPPSPRRLPGRHAAHPVPVFPPAGVAVGVGGEAIPLRRAHADLHEDGALRGGVGGAVRPRPPHARAGGERGEETALRRHEHVLAGVPRGHRQPGLHRAWHHQRVGESIPLRPPLSSLPFLSFMSMSESHIMNKRQISSSSAERKTKRISCRSRQCISRRRVNSGAKSPNLCLPSHPGKGERVSRDERVSGWAGMEKCDKQNWMNITETTLRI